MDIKKIQARFKYYRQIIADKDAEIEQLNNNIEDADQDIRNIQQQAHEKVYYAQQEAQRAKNAADAAETRARHERYQREDNERRRRLGLRIY